MRMDVEELPGLCGSGFEDFHTSYHKIHLPILLTACAAGAAGNLVNVVVLTRPRLCSPVDVTLAALAVAHLIESSLIAANSVSHHHNSSQVTSVLHLLQINCGALLGFVAMCLVLLAQLWSICDSRNDNRYKQATAASIATFLTSIVLHIPLFISFKISKGYQFINEEGSHVFYFDANTSVQNATILYHWTFSDVATENDHLLVRVNEWLYGVAFTIAPCLILLTLIIFKVVRIKCHHHHSQFVSTRSIEPRALLCISLLTLITESLLGALNMFKILLGQEFVMSCVLPLNEVIELASLIFPVATLFVYCKKSDRYWSTLILTFKPKFFNRWWPNKQQTTTVKEQQLLLM